MMKDAGRVALTFVAGLVVVFGGALTYSRAHGSRVPVEASRRAHVEEPKSAANTAVSGPSLPMLKERQLENSSEDTTASNANPPTDHILGSRFLGSRSRPDSNSMTTPSTTVAVQVAKRELGAPMPSSGSTLTSFPSIQERIPVAMPRIDNAEISAPSPQAVPTQTQAVPIRPVLPKLDSVAAHDQRYTPEQQQVEYRPAEQPHRITGAITGSSAAITGADPQFSPKPAPFDPPPSVPRTRVTTVQPGTTLAVRVSETLSSDRNRTGNTFPATLASPLVVNGFVVARGGSTVLGRVVNARRAPVIGGRSELTLALTNITTADGNLVRIDTSTWDERGAHSSIVNTAKMATGAAVGAVVGAVTGAAEGAGLTSALQNGDRTDGFMATKRTVVLPAGTEIVFSLATPLTTTEKLIPGAE